MYTAIFFINGDADNTTPLPGMQALYQAASAPKQNWIVPNAGHAQSFAIDPGGYMQRVDEFFDTYLPSVWVLTISWIQDCKCD